MKKTILTSLEKIPYFTIEAVKQIVGSDCLAEGTVRTALYRWMKSGEVIQLKKGVYTTRRFFEVHRSEEDFSMAVSAILIPASYVSLEYILQKHAILTEVTYPVSAVTTKNTRTIHNKVGIFTYRHMKQDLYLGYEIINYHGVLFAKASAAKALFDMFYLHPGIGQTELKDVNLAEELRFNLDEFTPAQQLEFAAFVKTSRSTKMERILANLRRTVWRI